MSDRSSLSAAETLTPADGPVGVELHALMGKQLRSRREGGGGVVQVAAQIQAASSAWVGRTPRRPGSPPHALHHTPAAEVRSGPQADCVDLCFPG